MANYTREKSKYGGVTGSIQIFSTTLPLANDPLDDSWKKKIPAGFLRCDGSILNANEYPQLADVLGRGDSCKFKKETQELDDDQFQLPDCGSKVINPGLASGQYNSLNLVQTATENSAGKPRIGVETTVASNFGNSVEISYSGNFTVQGQSGLDLQGNSSFTPPETEAGIKRLEKAFLDQSNFQAHGHNSNARVINYTGNFKVGAIGKGSGLQNVFAGNTMNGSGNPTNSVPSVHDHGMDWPQSIDYDNQFVYAFPTVNIPADNIKTTINISTKKVEELRESVQPYILVEYIIKF